jgi:hypothetical protein
MGTWDAGNLDNDYALDELSERLDKLVKGLWSRAKKKTSREGDEYDYTTLFVEFEILFALEDRKLVRERCGAMPTPDEVEKVKLNFINEWDANIDALEPTEEHKQNRRKVILQTFNRFKRICRRHHPPEDSA